jgi:hypothetical protein
MEWVGDDGAASEGERRSELSVDFGEQDGLFRRRRTVELGQPCEPPPVGGGPESKRHARLSRNTRLGLSFGVREPVSVGSSAEVICLGLGDGHIELRGNHVRPSW